MSESNLDPYFTPVTSEKEWKEPSKEIPKEKTDDNATIFTEEGDKIALIRVFLSTIGKDISDVNQEFIDNIFSEDHFVPKIFSEYAEKNCKKCWGRGILGWQLEPRFKDRIPKLCACLRRGIILKNEKK